MHVVDSWHVLVKDAKGFEQLETGEGSSEGHTILEVSAG